MNGDRIHRTVTHEGLMGGSTDKPQDPPRVGAYFKHIPDTRPSCFTIMSPKTSKYQNKNPHSHYSSDNGGHGSKKTHKKNSQRSRKLTSYDSAGLRQQLRAVNDEITSLKKAVQTDNKSDSKDIKENYVAAPSALDVSIKTLEELATKDPKFVNLRMAQQSLKEIADKMKDEVQKERESNAKKSESEGPTHHQDVRMLRLMRGAGRPKLNFVRTKLAISGSSSSSANTGLALVINVDPSASSEFTNFQALFDEVKVTGGQFHYDFASSGGSPSFTDAAIAYDPIDLSAYATTVGVLVASQCGGIIRLHSATGTAALLEASQSVTRKGFYDFHFKCPDGPQLVATNSAAANQVVTGEWSATNQTPMQYGFIKGYVTAAGSSVVTTIYYYLIMDVMFRSRT